MGGKFKRENTLQRGVMQGESESIKAFVEFFLGQSIVPEVWDQLCHHQRSAVRNTIADFIMYRNRPRESVVETIWSIIVSAMEARHC